MRQRPRRASRALASVPESGKLRPQVPSAELIADARAAKRILDGEEDPDWGSSSSVSSYDLPKLDSEDEAEYVIADPVPNTESLQSASVQTADWEKPDTPRSAGASASQSFGFVSGQSFGSTAAIRSDGTTRKEPKRVLPGGRRSTRPNPRGFEPKGHNSCCGRKITTGKGWRCPSSS